MSEQTSDRQLNHPFSLYDWEERLQASDLSRHEIHGYAITLRWYLSFCKSNQVRTTYASAKAFLDEVRDQKSPSDEIYQKWRTALKWFS